MDYYRVPSNECSSYRESTGVLTLSAKLFDNNNTRRFFRFLSLFLFIFFFGKALKKVLMSFPLQLGWQAIDQGYVNLPELDPFKDTDPLMSFVEPETNIMPYFEMSDEDCQVLGYRPNTADEDSDDEDDEIFEPE